LVFLAGQGEMVAATKLHLQKLTEDETMLVAGGLAVLVVICLLLSVVQAPREIGR
jgi:hypothetical protein